MIHIFERIRYRNHMSAETVRKQTRIRGWAFLSDSPGFMVSTDELDAIRVS